MTTTESMSTNRKIQICELLKGIETGDSGVVYVVNENKYIQHNPQTHEGSEGLAELFKRLSKTSPRVNIVRVFEDGDYIFAHTEYEFSTSNIGFEIFRFEDDLAVEHWDNIQLRNGPNTSGHSMVDGATEVTDLGMTERNRMAVQSFIEDILLDGQHDKFSKYINEMHYTEHSPYLGDDLSGLRSSLSGYVTDGNKALYYDKCHRILAEGNFVLSVCEGYYDKIHTSIYDLYRMENGIIVEHWDTKEAIPPRSEWKNSNGKF